MKFIFCYIAASISGYSNN